MFPLRARALPAQPNPRGRFGRGAMPPSECPNLDHSEAPGARGGPGPVGGGGERSSYVTHSPDSPPCELRAGRGGPCTLITVTAASAGASAGVSASSTWSGGRAAEAAVVHRASGEWRRERQDRGDPHHGMAEDDLVPQGGVMPDYDGFVGIDWATQTPAVCLLDAPGRVIAVTSVAPSGPGLAQLLERLRQRAVPAERIAVAIETPRAALVEALLRGGCHVFAGNPKPLDRGRDRHRVAGAKDDRRDALVIAAALRTDGWAFRHCAAEDPQLIELREISRRHDELVPEHLRLASRRHEHLLRFSPQALARCPAADPPWLWTGLARVPTPAAAAGVRVGRLRAILADQRLRRFTAEERHRALTTAPLPGAPGPAAAAGAHVALLLPRRRLGHDQQGQGARRREPLLTRRATAAAAAHQPEPRDVPIRRAV